MDGVNNAFCMSKEQYELARLATKCAGLQGKIDDQAAEIAELREMAENIGNLHSVTLDEYSKLKALCDQMVQVIQMSDGCLYEAGKEVLEAWRSMK